MVIAKHFSMMPMYYNKAAELGDDPVERLKLIISAEIGNVIYNKSFEKPLNPILGETYEAHGQDGASIYIEQISHHPPISGMLVEHENYKMQGTMEWSIKAGLQSADVDYLGQRKLTFPDGGEIICNIAKDKIYGLFMGTFGHQITGKLEYRDEKNKLTAYVDFGAYMFKKQDYVWGEIKKDGKRVSEITGNYMGWLSFDDVRYWDYRESDKVNYPVEGAPYHLPSDSRNRTDGIFLVTRPVEEAQTEKERLENIQRKDKAMREASAARRESGGPKFVLKTADESQD